MKKSFYTISLFFILTIGGNSFFFNQHDKSPESETSIVTSQFHQGLDAISVAVNEYKNAANSLSESPESVLKLKNTHLNTRLAFKKIEFLLEYYDHETIKNFINGAPLLSLEPKVPEIIILEPEGLQVLDELVFGDDLLGEKKNITALIVALDHNFDKIVTYQKSIKVQHRHIFEAIRDELIRIFTLGVTGFDTPGSANAIPEAKVAIKSISASIEPYYAKIGQKDPALVKQLAGKFSDAIDYLDKNTSFEDFDRLLFLTEYINPLYKLTYQAHKVLGVETISEVVEVPQSKNYHSTNIFDNQFLNSLFYAGVNLKEEQSKKRVELGRMLFFDPILSKNNERACASCHSPEKAFTDGQSKSMATGMNGTVMRNAPTVINSVYAEKYFYDLREESLERQMKHVIFDSKEFDTDFIEIIDKIGQSKEYTEMFEDIYPTYKLSSWSISNALSSYVASLSSFNSPFDQYVRGEKKQLSEAAKRGFNLFMGKGACGTCHFAPTFNGTVPPLYEDSESEVLGVPANKDTINPILDPDLGRIANNIASDEAPFFAHSFKTTTVRNIALTAPYMHNGVYNTLEEVVDFYNKGGGLGMGMNVEYQTLPDTPLNLTKQEQLDLVAFMETLTDTTGMTTVPVTLPQFENNPEWNKRKIGGVY